MRFNQKVCLVTGGNSGICRAACLRFADEGGKVTVVGRNNDDGTETVALIEKDKGTAMYIRADIGFPEH